MDSPTLTALDVLKKAPQHGTSQPTRLAFLFPESKSCRRTQKPETLHIRNLLQRIPNPPHAPLLAAVFQVTVENLQNSRPPLHGHINQTTPLTHWQRTPALLALRTALCHATTTGKTPHPPPAQTGNKPI
jgi:hypothetical protein